MSKILELAVKQMQYAEEQAKSQVDHVYSIDSLTMFDLRAEIEALAMEIDADLQIMWRKACG